MFKVNMTKKLLYLLLVKLLDDFIVGQSVEVLQDEVEDKPVTNLLCEGKGVRVQECLNVRPFSRLSTLKTALNIELR